jgi:hypothetical protein
LTVAGSNASLLPATTRIASNLILSQYASFFGIDHDDGSNAYVDEGNVIAWSGAKSYLGFNKQTLDSLFIHAEASGHGPCTGNAGELCPRATPPSSSVDASGWPFCMMSFGQAPWPANMRDSFVNNSCITAGKPYDFNSCNASAPSTDGRIPLTANNDFLLSAGAPPFAFSCGGQSWTLTEAQQRGVELGSSVGREPSTAATLAMARAMLNM